MIPLDPLTDDGSPATPPRTRTRRARRAGRRRSNGTGDGREATPAVARGSRLVRTRTMTGIVGITLAGAAGGTTAPGIVSSVTSDVVIDTAGQPLADAADDHSPTDPEPREDVAAAPPAVDTDWRDDELASFDGVVVVRPAEDAPLVGFHEAARAGAVPLTSSQPITEAHGREPVAVEVDVAQPAIDDVETLVLPTRGRSQPAASAIDIAVEPDQVVHAPVSGTVLAADPYLLYGEVPDTRVVIQPTGRPDLRVVVLHVRDAQVEPGDVLEAGHTVLAAGPTPLPFESQVDRFTATRVGHTTPHVHLEIRTD